MSGTQYRSGIYVTSAAQKRAAEASKAAYQKVLSANGYGPITTEIIDAPEFYFAEDYHQQYLAKVPHGYCGLGGTGLSCPGRRRRQGRGVTVRRAIEPSLGGRGFLGGGRLLAGAGAWPACGAFATGAGTALVRSARQHGAAIGRQLIER